MLQSKIQFKPVWIMYGVVQLVRVTMKGDEIEKAF